MGKIIGAIFSGFSKINSGRLSTVVPRRLNKLARFLAISVSICIGPWHPAYAGKWFYEMYVTGNVSVWDDIAAAHSVDCVSFCLYIQYLILSSWEIRVQFGFTVFCFRFKVLRRYPVNPDFPVVIYCVLDRNLQIYTMPFRQPVQRGLKSGYPRSDSACLFA